MADSLKKFINEDAADSVTKSNIADHLEKLVDKFGLYSVLDDLADICGFKAEHINANYDDAVLADKWDKAGDKISSVAEGVRNLKLS